MGVMRPDLVTVEVAVVEVLMMKEVGEIMLTVELVPRDMYEYSTMLNHEFSKTLCIFSNFDCVLSYNQSLVLDILYPSNPGESCPTYVLRL